jgi:hypothetical protein
MPPSDGAPAPMRAAQVISRMPAGSAASRARMMNGLQAVAGNARIGRLADQAQLTVSQPGDPYEREAEHVAANVALMPTPANDVPTKRERSPSPDQAAVRPPAKIARLAHPDSAGAGDPRDRHLPAAQPGARWGEALVQRRGDDEPDERSSEPAASVSRIPGVPLMQVAALQVMAFPEPPAATSPIQLFDEYLDIGEPSIEGPLAPGTVTESHGLTVKQVDALHVEIEYGESWVRLAAEPGEPYAFSIGPPIEQPPKAPPPPFGLVGIGDAPKPELPQRLVRITATKPIDQQHIAENTRVPPLAVQTRYVSAKEVADQGAGLTSGTFQVIESVGDDYTQLQLEDSIVRIEVAPNATEVAADRSQARFAYWIDPEWRGPQATEKRVVIVAAPGVRIRTGTPEHAPVMLYGRKLVPEVARVPHPSMVPKQGTRFELGEFVHIDVVDPDAPPELLPGFAGRDDRQHTNEVDVATGLGAVSIVHPWSGVRLTITPTDPSIGAAYVWQVLPPLNGLPGEIRAIVGPGVTVALEEPVPNRLRDPYGGPTPTPKKDQARPGEGLYEQSFELKLVQVPDPGLVPRQGTPLNVEHFLRMGGWFRDPDQHAWQGTNDLPFMIATAATDLIIGLIPIVGQLYLIGEFAYTMATGHDWWGNEVDDGGKVVMGFGAALSLIPLVGGLGALLRGSAKVAVIEEFAAKWGVSVEEMQAVLIRVGAAAEGEDAAIVSKAMRAIEKGEELVEEDLPALRRVLAKVGAGHLGLEGIAKSGMGRLELALAAGGQPLNSENYLANLMSAFRTSGAIPDSLAIPLARSGQFGNAVEAEAAVQQALRDLARAEGIAADEAKIAQVAKETGQVVARIQASAVVEATPQTRFLAVSRPELVAQYERLVDQKLPTIVQDVLNGQGPTANRIRLAQLRTQFDQLRQQVGSAERLTNAQRDTARQILREARTLARDDFENVQKGVWRRLRKPTDHPDLAAIEQRLRAAGDVQGPQTGAMRVRMASRQPGDVGYESLNLEHKVRLSDDPWRYNDPSNLIASDSRQNQQYLEALRQQGSIWPTNDPVEDFIIRFELNEENINFAPHSR